MHVFKEGDKVMLVPDRMTEKHMKSVLYGFLNDVDYDNYFGYLKGYVGQILTVKQDHHHSGRISAVICDPCDAKYVHTSLLRLVVNEEKGEIIDV